MNPLSLPDLEVGRADGRPDTKDKSGNRDGALIARGAIRSPFAFRGLRGLGSGLPTSLEEIETAELQYLKLAEQWNSKLKFREWHREGFRRMRARLEGEPVNGPAVPANEHMS
jgi:tRNA-dihydrouridine synthase